MKQLAMKGILLLLSLSFFSLEVLDAQSAKKEMISASIFFLQNGRKFPLKKNKIKLKKAPFTVQVEYTAGKQDCLLVNVRTDKRNYKLARSGAPLDVSPASAMAEYLFNQKKELWIAKQMYHCWFYKSTSNHRYDEDTQQGDQTVFTRTIENVRFMDSDQPGMPIDQLEESDLYLVFFQDKRTDYSTMDAAIIGQVKIRFR